MAEEDRPRSATPTFIGNDRFLILMGSGAVVFQVAAVGDGYQVEELYRTDSLGKTYAQPVYHDGHVYGFSGQVLTCMNADTGERVWRSRPPGGDGLILVDGQLVIFGARGQVVVADASPVEYRERARVQALGGSSLTWPAFADGRIFVRNLNELAAISVSHDGGGLSAQQGDATDHAFGIWLSKLAANPARAAEVDAFLAAHPQSPIVEGEYLHFLYRGDATDVSIEGSMNNSEAVEQMQRVAGTDLFYRTYRVEPGCRWQYRYLVDFENSTPDPRNPRRTPAVEGDEIYSEVVTPGYRLAAYLDRADGTAERADSLSSFTLESKILGYEKEIRVWLPPGYADSTRTYPLLIVNDGDAWLDRGRMVQTLDSVVGTTVAPVVVAFVPAFGAWWTEGGGSRTEEYVRMLADELVPAMAGRYRLTDDASSRGIVGNRFYGASAIFAGLSRPETFGKVGMQSLYLGLGIEGSLERLVADGAGRSVRIYFDWNRYDERNIDRGFDIARSSRGFAASLFAGGYAVQGGESLDSYGWTSWRNRTGAVLESMFPAGATP